MEKEAYFLTDDASIKHYQALMIKVSEYIGAHLANEKVYSGISPEKSQSLAKNLTQSFQGETFDQILLHYLKPVLAYSVNINSAHSMAHLHCPVMQASLVAEMMISVLNQSMDSWDQSPIATYLEQAMIDLFSAKIYPKHISNADGVFTSGGTQSNLMGLLLARDYYCTDKLKHDIAHMGLPSEASKFRILCTEYTHFSVHKSLMLLGLGRKAICTVKVDAKQRMCPTHLAHQIEKLRHEELLPIGIVATTGGTDFGQIDAVDEISKVASSYDIWLHVDAAVGGALLLSSKHKARLAALDQADSVTIDFHKLFFQPISCGAFFCKNKQNLQLLSYHADYLNPEEDAFDALNLVDKSLQTTRRFDALKLFCALKHAGEARFGSWIDHIIDMTVKADGILRESDAFELAYQESIHAESRLNTIVFRYVDHGCLEHELNKINQSIYKNMLLQGNYLIARTKVKGKVYLKFTFMHPEVSFDLIKEAVQAIKEQGQKLVMALREERENDHTCL